MKKSAQKTVMVAMLTAFAFTFSASFAATLGEYKVGYWVYSKTFPTSSAVWSAHWSRAFEGCKQAFPKTRSVEMVSYSAGMFSAGQYYAVSRWRCRDVR